MLGLSSIRAKIGMYSHQDRGHVLNLSFQAQTGSRTKASTRYRGAIVWLALWSLLRLPVAVPDFHEVAHHHADGAECLYHEHLNRWHEGGPQSPASAASHFRHDPARLHWHWVIPGTSVPEGSSDNPDQADFSATPLGLSISNGPGTDSLSRMLECANHAAIVKHAAVDRFEPHHVYALSFLDASFCACLSLVHTHRGLPASNERSSVTQPLSFAPLRC